jgi:hypothetical protein
MQLALAHAQGGLHRRLVPDQGRVVPLGLVQRQYGLLQQLIRILSLNGPGHPEAAGQIEAALPGHELELQQAHHGLHLGFEAGLLAGQDHGKFISPQPVGPTWIGLPQPCGHRLQQAITDLVAEQNLANSVRDGVLTQAQADQIRADMGLNATRRQLMNAQANAANSAAATNQAQLPGLNWENSAWGIGLKELRATVGAGADAFRSVKGGLGAPEIRQQYQRKGGGPPPRRPVKRK